jgi:hypothetical protein
LDSKIILAKSAVPNEQSPLRDAAVNAPESFCSPIRAQADASCFQGDFGCFLSPDHDGLALPSHNSGNRSMMESPKQTPSRPANKGTGNLVRKGGYGARKARMHPQN